MLDLSELEQLVTFADCGTLSKAAKQLYLSQPTITRSMQHVEESFGVPLFHRGKNKITFNETGLKAVSYARNLLSEAENAVHQIQDFNKRLHTITVESCAPAPLWSLLPALSAEYPEMTISSSINEVTLIPEHVAAGTCDIGILPCLTESDSVVCTPFFKESLFLCVFPEHSLASKKSLTFADMNGYNFLLRSEIGFWDSLCRKKMPSSKFLVQTDDFAYTELIRESSLPCFTTNLARDTSNLLHNRIIIPVTDPEANVQYHLLMLRGKAIKIPNSVP